MASKQKILIVDDDNNIAELISLYLTKECYDTKIVNDGEEAVREFHSFQPNLILLDLMLPDGTGLDVLRKVKRVAPHGGAPSFYQWPQETVVSKAAESK